MPGGVSLRPPIGKVRATRERDGGSNFQAPGTRSPRPPARTSSESKAAAGWGGCVTTTRPFPSARRGNPRHRLRGKRSPPRRPALTAEAGPARRRSLARAHLPAPRSRGRLSSSLSDQLGPKRRVGHAAAERPSPSGARGRRKAVAEGGCVRMRAGALWRLLVSAGGCGAGRRAVGALGAPGSPVFFQSRSGCLEL